MYYFDNAATTVQKPAAVVQAVTQVLSAGTYGNPSRGAHGYALRSYDLVLRAKEAVKKLFQAGTDYEVAFTANSTTALNMVLKGLIRPGEGVLTTTWEHNAVLRPLYQLEKTGVPLSFIESEPKTGALCYAELAEKITPKTRWLVCNHASNVTGNVLDLARLKAFAKRHQLGLIVDASQTAGAFPLDLSDGLITAVCFTGHKSLYGPTGTGGLVIRRDAQVRPWLTGGDGVHSFAQEQPGGIPEVFAAGTANIAGIAGLLAAVNLALQGGVQKAQQKQAELAALFVPAVRSLLGVRLYGDFTAPRVGVYSLNFTGAESAVISDLLWSKYQMATRPAYHCAPLMHQSLGTAEQGTVRFSFSQFTTKEEVQLIIKALQSLIRL